MEWFLVFREERPIVHVDINLTHRLDGLQDVIKRHKIEIGKCMLKWIADRKPDLRRIYNIFEH